MNENKLLGFIKENGKELAQIFGGLVVIGVGGHFYGKGTASILGKYLGLEESNGDSEESPIKE